MRKSADNAARIADTATVIDVRIWTGPVQRRTGLFYWRRVGAGQRTVNSQKRAETCLKDSGCIVLVLRVSPRPRQLTRVLLAAWSSPRPGRLLCCRPFVNPW